MKTHSLRIATSAIALMLVVASASVAGHHGTNISYDRSKQFTTQAIVKSFDTAIRILSCTSSSRTTKARLPSGHWSYCQTPPLSSATGGVAPTQTRR